MSWTRRGRAPVLPGVMVAMVIGVLVLGGCGRSTRLGPEEAVEVMVLDGVARARADCMIAALDGELDFAKVTGLDVDLDPAEVDLLSSTASQCAPAVGFGGGVLDGASAGQSEAEVVAAQAAAAEVDVEAEVYRMVDEGLDPALTSCLVNRLNADVDPTETIADVYALAAVTVDCREFLAEEPE